MIKPNPDSCHLLLDSRLANEEVQKNPYTYNNIREVLSDGALNAATVEHPVTVYIAPGIYWLEDPQSEAVIVREDPKDLYPYGCKVNCARALCAVKAPHCLDGQRVQIHCLAAVAPAGSYRECCADILRGEVFLTLCSLSSAAYCRGCNNALSGSSVRVKDIFLNELFCSLSHVHCLNFKRLAYSELSSVDDRSYAYFGIIHVKLLSGIQ